jgi:FAD/FMN-containing dehydrogenase
MKLHSWGRYPVTESRLHVPGSRDAIGAQWRPAADKASVIARGLGRSYGDSALADDVVQMLALDNLLSFGESTGHLRCAAGVSLATLLQVFLPRGWMLPVVPGTRFVTVGGAIASDVHGKNHHGAGTFGDHVLALSLLQASGEIVQCSPTLNADLFNATCGGMGLTGIIVDATLALRRVPGSAIVQQTVRTANLQEVFSRFEEHSGATYSVAWLDCLARGDALAGRNEVAGQHGVAGQFRSGGERREQGQPGLVHQPRVGGEAGSGETAQSFADHRQTQQRPVPRVAQPRGVRSGPESPEGERRQHR